MIDRAERALRSLNDSVTRLTDTADGRPHLQAVVGSGCLSMNMAVVTVVAGPDGTLALRGVAFDRIHEPKCNDESRPAGAGLDPRQSEQRDQHEDKDETRDGIHRDARRASREALRHRYEEQHHRE